MTRRAYHKELKALEDEVCILADMAADAVDKSIRALKDRDIEASKEIVENDAVINKKRFEIENRCLLLLATQQPMAVDLRVIAAILSIITDLERIADHAEGNANISVMIGDAPLVKPITHLPKMAEISLKMLSDCMDAYKARDIESAKAVCDEDDKVDALYDDVYKELLMIMIDDQSTIKGATYLMWAAHNMERVADRVTNIAERVVFMVTGKLEEMNVSKY
ncbi:MAG: phosphate signaling complex protein PhoU [Proteobacteria bacterium]|nr:phosphate signaling complex protein PhoU [Pseudomonadota bacterium]